LFNPRHVTLSELGDLLGLDGLRPAIDALSLLRVLGWDNSVGRYLINKLGLGTLMSVVLWCLRLTPIVVRRVKLMLGSHEMMLHELLLLLGGVLKLVLTLVAELRQLGWRHLPKRVLLLGHGRKGLWGLSLFHFF